jgi:hypothetical protein
MMQVTAYFLLMMLFKSKYNSSTFGFGIKSSPLSRTISHRGQIRESTSIQLIDPNLDTMYQTVDVVTNTFFGSFISRAVGVFVGNLAAGLAFKAVSDVIFKKSETEIKEKEKEKGKSFETIVRPDISQTAWIKLVFCIMIDLAGDSSFLLPGIGELGDTAWAPASAYLLNLLFGSSAISGLEFAKEILPGTDILPVATLAWLLQNVFVDSPLTGILGLKPKNENEKVISVEKKESVSPEIDAWDSKWQNKK